jgi:cytoskeletal protein CcmA (bactofilin family)
VRTIAKGEAVIQLDIRDHLILKGTAHHVFVRRKAFFELHGQVFGTITVERGGRAAIFGRCDGGLLNRGDVDIYGLVLGKVTGRGRTRVSDGAMINGIRGRTLGRERTALANEEIKIDGGIVAWLQPPDQAVLLGAPLIETPGTIDGEIVFQGVATQWMRVVNAGALNLCGALLRGLVVDPGGYAVVNGVVDGGLTNNGTVDILGMVNGGVSGTGKTRIGPDATIDGVKGSDLRQGGSA